MNKTHLFLLVAVLGLAAFYAWGKIHKLEREEKDYQAKRYFPEKKDEDIESIDVTSADPVFHYVLRRRSEHWYLDDHLASQEKSPQLVNSLIELSTEREIAAKPTAKEEAEFGLDKPAYTIVLTGNGGEKLGTVVLGHRTPGGNHYYGKLLGAAGAGIATVPAYTLSPLEEEPKDLRENSPFPAEVAAVESFAFTTADGGKAELVRPKGENEAFRFKLPEDKPADETRVTQLMFLLKDLKVARFLDDKEKTSLGKPVVSYRAHEADSKYDLVSEFDQPVGVAPKLRYGRRFLTEVGKSEPVAGTEERFVIELLGESKALRPTLEQFEDRRILKVAVDKLRSLDVVTADFKLVAKRSGDGAWNVTEPSDRAGEADLSRRLDALLWAVRDLRFATSEEKAEPSDKGEWTVQLSAEDGKSYFFRFGPSRTGKPLVGFDNKSLPLQEDLVPALNDAMKALSPKTATPSPTPSPLE